MREITILSQKREYQTKSLVYPGGEVRLDIPDFPERLSETVRLIARIQSSNDLMCLLNTIETVERAGAKIDSVIVPYLPYARQDRVTEHNGSFSLRVLGKMLSGLNIVCYDVHSERAFNIFSTLLEVPQIEVVRQHAALNELLCAGDISVVAPDKGALHKAKEISELYQIPLITAKKVRDPLTGKLSRPEIESGEVQGKDCIIIDDICDGGGTFLQLADVLKSHGAGRLYLYVTHGIFSRGIEPILAKFDRVFTTDSFISSANSQFLSIHHLNLRENH